MPVAVRPDVDDAFSRGHICPKGVALIDVHNDPDRVRHPLRRRGRHWEEIGWEEALDEAAQRLAATQREHGKDAVAFYLGNPTAHDYGALLAVVPFVGALATKNSYSSNSVDGLPRMLASTLLYGSPALIPVPDLDRTQHLLIIGANPVVSNGSIMSAPGCAKRLKQICARGGKVVVIDPRRTETAQLADQHVFIRPGSDGALLAAMLHWIFENGRVNIGRLAARVDGVAALRHAVAAFSPERVAVPTGIAAETIVGLARDFATASSAACYGRMGVCTQRHGTLASWLIDALNLLTGNLDAEGGAMFPAPAIDLGVLARRLGLGGSYDRYRSRVRGLPEFNSELPVAALADELETPGRGQIRALVTHAGNPVLSLPHGRRLDRALARLDFMVCIDIYVNESTRHADLILPSSTALEHDTYPLLFAGLSVRNYAKYSAAVLDAGENTRPSSEILRELTVRHLRARGLAGRALAAGYDAVSRRFGPRRTLELLWRFGRYGKGIGLGRRADTLDFASLAAMPHGIDLGPLTARLPGALATAERRIDLRPALIEEALTQLRSELDQPRRAQEPTPLLLISRRQTRSNNSWLHNSPRLMRGKPRCTLLMHPDDARRWAVAEAERVVLRSRVGEIEVPLELSEEMMPGVVCLPHGWGHHRQGMRLKVACATPGASINDVTDDRAIDRISGCSDFNGVPVTVTAAR